MKREFLEGLNLEAAVIDQIMAENGKDIEREKQKTLAAQEEAKATKAQLESANKTIEGFKDYDQTKSDVEKYKAEAETAKKEAAAKIASLERTAHVKDFLSGKKFVNDITRDATKDQKNILADDTAPAPPVQGSMKGTSHAADERAAARAVMGLPPEKD